MSDNWRRNARRSKRRCKEGFFDHGKPARGRNLPQGMSYENYIRRRDSRGRRPGKWEKAL
jgi:hypothetical protein